MRTFSRSTFEEARRLWDEGEFGPRWARIRHIAAERGFVYPPSGSVHDDRDADEPSQRAIVWRCLQDNPKGLEIIVRRSSSWSQVVDGIIGLEGRLADAATLAEEDAIYGRREWPSHRESVMSIGAVIRRIADSVGGKP